MFDTRAKMGPKKIKGWKNTKILWKWGLKSNFYENSGQRDLVVKYVDKKDLANLKKGVKGAKMPALVHIGNTPGRAKPPQNRTIDSVI